MVASSEKTAVLLFFDTLKKHCSKMSGDHGENCEDCGLRNFCFTAPCSLDEQIILSVLRFLE